MTLATTNAGPFSARRLANTTNATAYKPPTKTCPAGSYNGYEYQDYKYGMSMYSVQDGTGMSTKYGKMGRIFDTACCSSCGPKNEEKGGWGSDALATCESLVKKVIKGGCFSDCYFAMTDEAQTEYLSFTNCGVALDPTSSVSDEAVCCSDKEVAAARITIKQSFSPAASAATNTATAGLASIAILAT